MRLPVAGCRIITCSLLSTQDLLQTGRSSGVCRLRAGFVLLRHRRVLSALVALLRRVVAVAGAGLHLAAGTASADRKSVGSGKRVSVRVDLGGRRIINKKKK